MPEDPTTTKPLDGEAGNEETVTLADDDITEEPDGEIPISEALEGATNPDGLLDLFAKIDNAREEAVSPTSQIEAPDAHPHFYTILLKDLREETQANRKLVTSTADRGTTCKFCGIEMSVARAIRFAEKHAMISPEEASELTSALTTTDKTQTPQRITDKPNRI